MIRGRTSIEHDEKNGFHIIKIWIPDGLIAYDAMKTKMFSYGNPRLTVLAYAKEIVEKEALWYSCPDWELDYGVCYD